jgi:RNase P/RNase MRP subunit p30
VTPERRQFLLSLQPGDLLRINGKLRVLRYVRHRRWRNRPTTASYAFSILRCSWTRRPITCKNIHDLATCTVELVARNYQSKHPISQLLDADLRNNTRVLDCCDVIGVIS